uniref:3-phosphoinositide-dependent protein kinase 1 n=1 Tax=Angiostrongylus costaricensis TaxID=334426 RepID=A0A0R3PRJ8_ANGCS
LEPDENKGLSLRLRKNGEKLQKLRKRASDFFFLRILGEGAYSTVSFCIISFCIFFLGTFFARYRMKVVQKDFVIRHQKLAAAVREKHVLASLTYERGGHPFVTRLYCTFHDPERLCKYVQQVARKFLFDLLFFVKIMFIYRILINFRYGVVHRDVKPENVLLRKNGHIMLTDFGSAQIYDESLFGFHKISCIILSNSVNCFSAFENTRRATFVGTAQYVSPEMLRGDEVGPPCDYWALGAIVFQMISGLAPFRAINDFHLLNKIQKLDFTFPSDFPGVVKDFVSKLLVLDPVSRLGSDDLNNLKSHEFFSGINWNHITDMRPPNIILSVSPVIGSHYCLEMESVKYVMFTNLTIFCNFLFYSLTRTSFLSRGDMVELLKVDKKAMAVRQRKLEKQRKENPYHLFVQDNLIIRSGFIDKKKGLFSRRRMFLLTEGPHLFYVDPNSMELKGEVPWSPCMRTEVKNFRAFFVHTVFSLFLVKIRYADKIAESYARAVKDGTFGMNKFKKSCNYFGDKRKKNDENAKNE